MKWLVRLIAFRFILHAAFHLIHYLLLRFLGKVKKRNISWDDLA